MPSKLVFHRLSKAILPRCGCFLFSCGNPHLESEGDGIKRIVTTGNAARSTGPRTAEGKAHSAQNARKHGFATTSYTVIRLEDADAVARLRADLVAVYQPVNSQELFALERMALAQLSILRAAQLEASLFTSGINDCLEQPYSVYLKDEVTAGLEITPGQNRAFFMAEGFRRLCAAKGNDPWRVFLRYQAQAERNYRRVLEEFERLKALRNELPNEPTATMEAESQPQENSYIYTRFLRAHGPRSGAPARRLAPGASRKRTPIGSADSPSTPQTEPSQPFQSADAISTTHAESSPTVSGR